MGPFLSPMARLWITRVRTRRLAVGDVVAFSRDDRIVLHRLVGRSGGRWLVRGDAQPAPEVLDDAEVLGRVQGLALRRFQWRGAPRIAARVLGRAIVWLAPRWQWVRPLVRRPSAAAA